MKMKIPSGSSFGNGYYNHDVNILSYLSDNSDSASEGLDSPTLDGDFSEYLWMENEEEFDQQVMKELEEEALMEECIEAMLEEELDNRSHAPTNTAPPNCQPWSTDDLSTSASLVQSMSTLRVSDDLAKQVSKSTLNPNATEFVPRPRPSPAVSVEGKV